MLNLYCVLEFVESCSKVYLFRLMHHGRPVFVQHLWFRPIRLVQSVPLCFPTLFLCFVPEIQIRVLA